MYRNNYSIPDNSTYMYNNEQNDDRFLFPFLVGGVAGTALGYGLANNNNNNPQVFYPYPPYPYQNQYNYYPQPYPIYYSYRR